MSARRCAPFLTLQIALLPGCLADPSSTVGFTEVDPAARMRAASRAAATDDRSAIPELISMLDSDDPAERVYAIRALRAMTDQDFGYRHFDDEVERHPAVERWQAWSMAHSPDPSQPDGQLQTYPIPADK